MAKQLKKCDLARNLLMTTFLKYAAYYKPIKLHPIGDIDQYTALEKDGFCRLAYMYPLKNNHFGFSELTAEVFERFIQLLAPLTLYHFSKTSKSVYFDCLDTRGLEYGHIEPGLKTSLNGAQGMRSGYTIDGRMMHYQVSYGTCRFFLDLFLDHPQPLSFVKRYIFLNVFVGASALHPDYADVWAAICHPQLEIVAVYFHSVYCYTLEKFAIILDCCKNVKHLRVHNYDEHEDDEVFYEFKILIESWSIHATRLNVFIINYGDLFLQLDGHKLVRCVYRDNQFYLAADCKIIRCNYWFNTTVCDRYPCFRKSDHYEDIIDGVINSPEQVFLGGTKTRLLERGGRKKFYRFLRLLTRCCFLRLLKRGGFRRRISRFRVLVRPGIILY